MRVCFCTSVWVDTEARHRGVFVHETVGDSAVGALVCVHGVNLQDEGSRRLVLQDRGAVSVLLTLRSRRRQVGERKKRSGRQDRVNVTAEKLGSIDGSVGTEQNGVGVKQYLVEGQKAWN